MKYFELTEKNTQKYANVEAGEVLLFLSKKPDQNQVERKYLKTCFKDDKDYNHDIDNAKIIIYDITKEQLQALKKYAQSENFYLGKITTISDIEKDIADHNNFAFLHKTGDKLSTITVNRRGLIDR